MYIHNLSNQNSILNTFLYEIRSVSEQDDSMRFRKNIERIGEVLCYEMSKELNYSEKFSNTPLGQKNLQIINNDIVICSILRAGLPMHIGVLNYFDKAENAFISAYRSHNKDNPSGFEIIVEYVACPSLENKTLILVDPMLATGQSLISSFEALKAYGNPKDIHIVSIIGSKVGVDYINDKFPDYTQLWIADIDYDLNDKGYIIPGLGDAGDLAFGQKL